VITNFFLQWGKYIGDRKFILKWI